MQALIGTRISFTCECNGYNGITNPYWTFNGKKSTALGKRVDESCCSSHATFIETSLTLAVTNDSALLCCRMKGSSQWCLYLQPQKIIPKMKISIGSHYLGNDKWNLTVNCSMGINVESYRDNTIIALVFNGNTSNLLVSQEFPADGFYIVDGVLLFTRKVQFSHILRGKSPVTAGCFVTFDFGTYIYAYENVAEKVFSPVVPSENTSPTHTFSSNSSLSLIPTGASTYNSQSGVYNNSSSICSSPTLSASPNYTVTSVLLSTTITSPENDTSVIKYVWIPVVVVVFSIFILAVTIWHQIRRALLPDQARTQSDGVTRCTFFNDCKHFSNII